MKKLFRPLLAFVFAIATLQHSVVAQTGNSENVTTSDRDMTNNRDTDDNSFNWGLLGLLGLLGLIPTKKTETKSTYNTTNTPPSR